MSSILLSGMYGPPPDCKKRLVQSKDQCVNVSGLWLEILCSPGHDDDPRPDKSLGYLNLFSTQVFQHAV